VLLTDRTAPGAAAGADPERAQLRETFNRAAELYQRARPEYPAQLYEDLIASAGLRPEDRLLEVGCATGKATLPLARRGFSIRCIELGSQLAAAARRNLAGLDVAVIEGPFETWNSAEKFALVFAATAWHWVDPAVKYRKAWEVLRSGGYLAFWSAGHVFPEGGDPFFREIQGVYDEIGEGMPEAKWPRPGEVEDQRGEIERSGLFEVVLISRYDWEQTFDADGYIELLNTFSGHIAMEAWQRDRLYAEVRRRLAERPGGSLRRHWEAILHVCRRVDEIASTFP
jgi:SAM-dependent methyltransferase